ncbi:MAG: hypothetical protein GYA24_15260, partial [Candidatus Lokiarchaeota archaeon]|nr:hypothetical protein [Candidatus Lokiarchaeota archaeon]
PQAAVPVPAAVVQAPQAVVPVSTAAFPPVIEQKPSSVKISTPDKAKIDEIAPTLLKDLEKVIIPIYEGKMEDIFSTILALVEKPHMLRAINKILINELEKLDDITPEARIIDIIAYLAAHDPVGFTDLLSELLSDAMKLDDVKQLGNIMHIISLIMGASQVKRQEVLRDFIKESVSSTSEFVIEKARKLINYFINKHPSYSVIICKTLVEILTPELESTKPNVALMNNLVFFLLSIDAILVGETIITDMPEAVHPRVKSLLEAISCGQSFNKIVNNIIDAYQAGEYDALKKALNVKKVPAHVQIAVLKRKYVAQLLKAGSVPLEMFANKLGMPLPEAEKLIYEMILKGDISAKMEVVSGKLYIVKDEKTVAGPSNTR